MLSSPVFFRIETDLCFLFRYFKRKQFGAIPGVPIGTWFETRALCSQAAIHAYVHLFSPLPHILPASYPDDRGTNRPWVAGIHGDPDEGAYSIALSGGYADDVDLGEAFTYTGLY